MSAQTKGLAALLAAHGRNGDTELMHVTKGEVAALNRIKRGLDGADLPRNPRTGLREANFFNQYVVPVLPAVAGLAAGAMTGGTMAAPAAALAGAATGAGTKAIQGGSTQDVLMGGGLGAISGYGAGTLGAGLAEAGTGAATTATTPGATTAVVPPADAGLGGANAFTGTPTFGGTEQAFGSFGGATPNASNAFVTGMQDGAQAFNAGTPAATAAPTAAPAAAPVTPPPANSELALQQYHDVASVNGDTGITTLPSGQQVANTPVTPPPEVPQYASKMEFLKSDAAAGAVPKVAMGTLGLASLNQGDLSGTDTGVGIDKTLPKSEVYYTSTGERRTRVVDRPQYGNVNMARGGDVYGDYEGVDEAADGGYHPGGGLNYAGGGLMGTGWGEQTRGGFSGLTESLQPGGALGEWHGKLYGALGADQVMPGGAMGSLIPGANQYNAQKRKEDERKRAEEEAGIAAAAKAKQEADFKQKWDERYTQGMAEGGYTGPQGADAIRTILQEQNQERDRQNQLESYRALWPIASVSGHQKEAGEMRAALQADEDKRNAFNSPVIRHIAGKDQYAGGGIANLGYYSDGGQLLRGPGDGVSDSIPASIEGKRPARLADGEFVIPARAVSELGNGSTEAGSKQLYAMLDRIAKKRKSGKGLAYQSNPKKILPV